MDILAIVGSAPHNNRPAFACPRGLVIAAQQIEVVLTMVTPDMVISGGAPGVDELAEQEAMTLGIPFRPIRPRGRYPTWDSDGGYRERNEKVAQECTRLLRIACAESRSYGSGWTADRAEELGKTVERFWIDRDGNVHTKQPRKQASRRTGTARPDRGRQLELDVVSAAPTAPMPPRRRRAEDSVVEDDGWSDRWL